MNSKDELGAIMQQYPEEVRRVYSEVIKVEGVYSTGKTKKREQIKSIILNEVTKIAD